MRPFLFIMLVFLSVSARAQMPSIPWDKYMDQQSLYWDSLSTNFYTGIPLGNGRLGTLVYKENSKALRFNVGRSDVTDNRPHYPDSMFTEQLVSRPRLPIGKFLLLTKGDIVSTNIKLDIYKAEASGTVTTTQGKIKLHAFVPTGEQVIHIKAEGTGGEDGLAWQWVPEKSVTPRFGSSRVNIAQYNYSFNPPPVQKDTAGFNISRQKLTNGGGYTTAWQQNGKDLTIAVGYGPEAKDGSAAEAIDHLKKYGLKKPADVFATHQIWWSNYFQQSFIAVPDARMQSYYWLQLYSLASATRKGEPMVDLMGPWFTSATPWPAIWWNLNTQLSYSNIFVTNHLETGFSLFDHLNRNIKNLISNVPVPWRSDAAAIGRITGYDLISPLDQNDLRAGRFEPGDLTWTLYYYHRYFLYSGDTVELTKRIYPLLKRSVNYLVHLLKLGTDGRYHLPTSHSPEYADADDAHYTLTALKWGLQTLMDTDSMLDRHDTERTKWKYLLDKLPDYYVNETGYMIGKNVALTSSHRHYSHLMMIYPYKEVDPDDAASRALMEKSIRHWLSMPSALAGYSYTGSASMYAYMRKGDSVRNQLNRFLNRHGEVNGLYKEAGPCFESPQSWVTAFAEMLLQSHNGVVSVFPAMPKSWANSSFRNLRAEGAFRINAVRAGGQTSMIRVISEKGGRCVLETDIPISAIEMGMKPNASVYHGRTRITIDMRAGDEVLIRNANVPSVNSGPVAITNYADFKWGLNRKNDYSNEQKFNW
jgi:hypothetical protein